MAAEAGRRDEARWDDERGRLRLGLTGACGRGVVAAAAGSTSSGGGRQSECTRGRPCNCTSGRVKGEAGHELGCAGGCWTWRRRGHNARRGCGEREERGQQRGKERRGGAHMR